jgi:hypothetical protein
MSNDYDIVIVESSIFQKRLTAFDTKDIPQNIIEKKEELKTSCSCFSMNYETKFSDWIEKKYPVYSKQSWKDNKTSSAKSGSRLHILPSNFTQENKSKKKITGLLNKLTESNSKTIVPQIEEEISSTSDKLSLYNLIWSFIETSCKTQFIHLIKLYGDKYNVNVFTDFVNKKKWYPDDFILNQPVLFLSDEEYDIYCKYVKWKTSQTNILNAWCVLWKNSNSKSVDLFDKLTNDIFHLLDECLSGNMKVKKHITDYCLDQIHTISRHYLCKNTIQRLKTIDQNLLESSSKFLVKDILDLEATSCAK